MAKKKNRISAAVGNAVDKKNHLQKTYRKHRRRLKIAGGLVKAVRKVL